MPEDPKTIITSLSEILPNHTYNVNTSLDNCSVNLSAQTLLDIATYAQANRTKLEQEAQENIENVHTQLEDTVEMRPINPDWRYRTSDLRLSSLYEGGKPAHEGAELDQCAQSQDVGDTSQVNPDWRYKTSD